MSVRLDGQSAPSLADVLRGAGLTVDETAVPDWRLRSRGGNTQWYTPLQMAHLHVMMHDTATSPTAHNTVDRERREATLMRDHPVARPCSNLYLGPSGIWYPISAGPANTNGEGHDWWGGGIPDDAMNSYSIAIEHGNDGVGEPYQAMDSYITGVAALARAYAIPVGRVRCHFEWAPTRKINLSAGAGYPGDAARYTRAGGDRYGRFDMDAVRADITRHLGGPSIPTTPPEDSDMLIDYLVRANGTIFATNMVSYAVPVDEGASPSEAECLRDRRLLNVAADHGPWVLVDPAEISYVLKLAAR